MKKLKLGTCLMYTIFGISLNCFIIPQVFAGDTCGYPSYCGGEATQKKTVPTKPKSNVNVVKPTQQP